MLAEYHFSTPDLPPMFSPLLCKVFPFMSWVEQNRGAENDDDDDNNHDHCDDSVEIHDEDDSVLEEWCEALGAIYATTSC